MGGKAPTLVLSRPHGQVIGTDPLSWSTVVRYPEQKMELNPTILNFSLLGDLRERETDTDTHGHTQNPLLASQHLFRLIIQKQKGH